MMLISNTGPSGFFSKRNDVGVVKKNIHKQFYFICGQMCETLASAVIFLFFFYLHIEKIIIILSDKLLFKQNSFNNLYSNKKKSTVFTIQSYKYSFGTF